MEEERETDDLRRRDVGDGCSESEDGVGRRGVEPARGNWAERRLGDDDVGSGELDAASGDPGEVEQGMGAETTRLAKLIRPSPLANAPSPSSALPSELEPLEIATPSKAGSNPCNGPSTAWLMNEADESKEVC